MEERSPVAKSVFHFAVKGFVAKFTQAGISWLLFIRRALGDRVHFWPFDGWDAPLGKSVVLEVYPCQWSAGYPVEGRTPDQHNAYSVAARQSTAAVDGRLLKAMMPELSLPEMAGAQVEGCILGVPWDPLKKPNRSAKPTAKVGGASSGGKTIKAGYVSNNYREVLQATDPPSNDHDQVV